MALVLRLGDGFCSLTGPSIPEKVLKTLRYWHRSLKLDKRTYKRVSAGEYRTLYQIQPQIDPITGETLQELLTLPGFFHRLNQVCINEGLQVTLCDLRTPFPEPNYERALEKLRPYQRECVITALMSRGGIISAHVGYGKTHVLGSIISAFEPAVLKARNTPLVVVAAPNKDVVRKNWEDLKEMLPGRDVGLVMSGYTQFSDDVQLITMDSLDKINMEEVGILIGDEIHNAATEGRTDVFAAARLAARWGFSATPFGRFDGRDLVTEGIFGPVVYTRTFAQGVKDGSIVPIKVYWMKAPEPNIGLRAYMQRERRQTKYKYGVNQNQGRNDIIRQLMQKIPDTRQTLCIMQFMDQMNTLSGLCPQIACVHGSETDDALIEKQYTNLKGVSKKMRKEYYDRLKANEIKKVFATYVYKQGVNFPEMQIVINAGGGGSDILAQQIPGRASRATATKDEAYIVDFWHPWDIIINDAGREKPGPVHSDDLSRSRAYETLGLEQTWIENVDQLPFLAQPA